MKKILLLILGLLLNLSGIIGQMGTINPELDALLKAVVQKHYDLLGIKGLSTAMALPDGGVWTGTAGYSHIIGPDTFAITPEVRFGVGGVTKTLTAACILQLQEEGLLDLDDKIGSFLPTFANVNPNIRIKQLLNHTSGVFNFSENPAFFDSLGMDLERIWTPEEILSRFISSPYFPPSFDWRYSNSNFLLLGLVIEKVTGNSFESEIRNRLSDPLGLSSIRLKPQEVQSGPVAHFYFDVFGNGETVDANALGLELDAYFSSLWASGAYFATPADIAVWMQQLFVGEVLEEESLAQMQTIYPLGTGIGYGLGLFKLELAGKNAWGQPGDIIYSSQVYYLPSENISVAVHANDAKVNSNGLSELLIELIETYCNFEPVTSTVSNDLPSFDFTIYPVPARDYFTIEFSLDKREFIKIDLYNALGQKVNEIAGRDFGSGNHQVNWRGIVPKGLYYCKIQIEDFRISKRIMLGFKK